MDEMPALERLRPQQAERCIVERQQCAAKAPVYILKDARGRRYMKLSEEGLFVWQLIDGEHTIGDLCGAYVARFGRPTPDEVLRALGRWLEAGFVRFRDIDQGRGPMPAPVTWADMLRPLLSLCTRYWWLSDLDGKVTALYRGLRVLYTRPAQVALLAVVCAGAGAFGWHLASGSWAPLQRSLPVWLAGLALHLVVHEAAHAATCKHFGRQVNRAGIG
jgi:Coenzyme PQQ synthesis protein D (PqqD)